MTTLEMIKEFWPVLVVFTILLIAGSYFIYFISKHGVKGLSFIGKEVEELGVINGGQDRPKDSITVYKLTDIKSKNISWCLNVITKSRQFHGAGRIAGEIPLTLNHDEINAIISTFERYRG